MSKNCLVFLTNKINRDIFRYVLYLQKEIGSFMDVWLVYDSSVQKVNNLGLQDIKFFQYPFHTISNFFHQGSSLLANPLLGLLKFAETYHYDHYLLMENDIVFNGVFSKFAARINAEDVDYIHIATDILGGLEKHWPVELIRNNPFAALYFSWCQIFYVSSRFLNELAKFMIVNDTFYYEFLLPSLAYSKGVRIRQFENFGYKFCLSWGPAEEFEYAYQKDRQPNTFYHPIKNLKIVDF